MQNKFVLFHSSVFSLPVCRQASRHICSRLIENVCFLVVLSILAVSCKKFEGDVTNPAFLAIDKLQVCQQSVGAPSTDVEGWYTCDIDAVQLVAYFTGESSESVIGTFQLPCHAPILYNGTAQYIRVVPVVKQNGIASTRIQYPYYLDTTIHNVKLTSGQTTYIGTLDTNTHQHVLPIYYKGNNWITELVYDNFEPLQTHIAVDTNSDVMWVRNDPQGARCGSGYLKVHTPADMSSVSFPITNAINVNDPSKVLYLEMDYRSDVQFRVGIRSSYVSGGQLYSEWVMVLYPREEWGKIYINLGKLWSQFNHPNTFQILFATINSNDAGGNTYIDNLKVIAL
ncbi:MAG: hypothetical protein KBT04_06515 [Bacteroidales bacterium]|nr:hypothetical protein [Candidatus Colimorpha onthohippi]